jgi:hypothetical protein
LAAQLLLEVFQSGVQMPDGMIAALGITRIRKRMRRQPSQSALVDDDVNVLDEVGCWRSTVPPEPVKLTGLHGLQDRPEIRGPQTVNTVGVDNRPITENLERHRELAAVVRAA